MASERLFEEGVDNIVQEGALYRWWPGVSANFKEVYIQISERAFRYFLNRYNSQYGKPLSAFRRKIIQSARPYKINKQSYLKPGAMVTQRGREERLFDNCFELVLKEDYERNFQFRDILKKESEDKARQEYRHSMMIGRQYSSPKKVPTTAIASHIVRRSADARRTNSVPRKLQSMRVGGLGSTSKLSLGMGSSSSPDTREPVKIRNKRSTALQKSTSVEGSLLKVANSQIFSNINAKSP